MPDTRPATSRRDALSRLLILATGLLPRAALAQEAQARTLVFGDSQAQGLAAGFQRFYRADKEQRILDRSKISTGLARPSFDWPAQARLLATTEHADVAIALFGANDRPNVRANGHVDENLLRRFTDGYAARVTEIMQAFRQSGTPLVWVGHPIVRDPAYAEDIALLNDIFADCAATEGATFVPTSDAFKGPDGAYTPYGRGLDGQTVRLRADDGVHMTPAGYDVLTALLLPEIERVRRPAAPYAAPPAGRN
ncbi:MAG: SGNH/GDSL hydrolase family protein [Janthinobacterium lividum]